MSTVDAERSLVHCQLPSLRGSAELPAACRSQYSWTMFATPPLLDGPSRSGLALRVCVGVATARVGGGAAGRVTDGAGLGDRVTFGVVLGVAEELRGVAELGVSVGISG